MVQSVEFDHVTGAGRAVVATAPVWHTARVNDGDAIDAAVTTECDKVIERPQIVESYPGLPVCDDCSYLRLVRGDSPEDNAFLRFLNGLEG